jgi:hypothetical protein
MRRMNLSGWPCLLALVLHLLAPLSHAARHLPAIAVTDPLGRVTETVYDSRNRPTDVYAPTVWDANAGAFVRPHSHTEYDEERRTKQRAGVPALPSDF